MKYLISGRKMVSSRSDEKQSRKPLTMILKKAAILFGILILSITTAIAQDSSPAGKWIASCDSPKLKFDDGYEICLIDIDTGMYDPGYFSSEFYYAVDYVMNSETSEFECSDKEQTWEDWGINLYFSFSYSGEYSQNQVTFDAGEGYFIQSSYQLKPEFLILEADYHLIGSDQLEMVIDGKRYLFYRMHDGRL